MPQLIQLNGYQTREKYKNLLPNQAISLNSLDFLFKLCRLRKSVKERMPGASQGSEEGLLLNKSSLRKINRPPKPCSLVHAFLILTLWITVGNNPCTCLCVQQTMTKRSAHISPLNILFWVPTLFRAWVDDWKPADTAFDQIICYETVHMQGRYQAQVLYRGLE